MSAVLTAQEPSAKYLVNLQPPLVRHFDLVAQAPGGVARLRELILTLAVQGKLVPQDPSDEPASELLKKIRAEKDRLIAEGKIKRGKPLAAISDEEKPFELPVSWEWCRLGAVTTYGSSAKAATIKPETWVLDLEDVEKGTGKLLNKSRFSERPALSDKNVFFAGDVLYGKLRPYLNKVLVADEDGICTTEIVPLRCYGPYEPGYFAIALRTPFFLEYVNALSYGMKMPRLGTEDARKALLPLPPLAEQSRIVTRVEELMQLCDALEASGQLEAQQHAQLVTTLLGTLTQSETPEALADNWQRIATHFDVLLDRPEAVDALEQTILQLAVRGLLTSRQKGGQPSVQLDGVLTGKGIPNFPLPDGWHWSPLGDLAELINGDRGQNYPNKAEYVSIGIPFINTGHIDPDGSLSSDRMNFLTREKFDSLRGGKVRKGDLVYCLRGATLGKTAIVDYEEGAIASSLVILRPIAALNNRFAYLYLTSPIGRSFIWQHDNGSAQPNLAAASLKKYWIPLPPLVEQIRIVTRVNELRVLCADLRQRLSVGQAVQSRLADALVTG